MYNNNTRFTAKIRIDPKQLEWIKTHKGTYRTMAGKLDEMINRYKRLEKRKIKQLTLKDK